MTLIDDFLLGMTLPLTKCSSLPGRSFDSAAFRASMLPFYTTNTYLDAGRLRFCLGVKVQISKL